MLKWLLIGLGATSIVGGTLTFWLPSPIGVPLMLLGTTLLVRYSPHARRQLALLIRRYPQRLKFLNRLLRMNDRSDTE